MSKQSEWSLLVPGPLGWEIWKRQADGAFERAGAEDGPMSLGELTGLPNGDLAMLFPVRGYHALPFRAASTDEALFGDLAVMHAERLGIRPDPMAGQLTDHFEVSRDDDSTLLLHVVLKKPGEGELPIRTPKEFDLSPRAFPVQGDAVSVWKELGRWVFAIHSGGKLVYSQATSSSSQEPDHDVLQEIRLALSQLGIQGIGVVPTNVHVWPPEGELGGAGELAGAFAVKPKVERRPDPVLPEKLSELLPADVRAARLARKERNQKVLIGAIAAVAYLAVVGWFGYNYWTKLQERNDLLAEVEDLEGGTAGVLMEHNVRWDELGGVTDSKLNPMEIMKEVQKAIPNNSGLRLTTADIDLAQKQIQIIGNAPAPKPVTDFYGALKRNPSLKWLVWNDEPPSNTPKGWDFRIKAEPEKEPEM